MKNNGLNNTSQNTFETSLKKILLSYDCRNFVDALKIAKSLLPQFENKSRLWNILGVIYISLGDSKNAIRSFEKAVKIEPSNAEYQNNYGVILKQEDRLGEAAIAFDTALKLQPLLISAAINLGDTLRLRGDNLRATKFYERALKHAPENIRVQNSLGTCFFNVGEYAKAAKTYKLALSHDPIHVDSLYNLAVVFQEQNNLDDAKTLYQRALGIKPQFPEALLKLGRIVEGEGKIENALTIYRRALLAKPDYAEAYIRAGNCFEKLSMNAEAIRAYESAIELKKAYGEAYHHLGELLESQGELKSAINLYRKAVTLFPDSANLYTKLGALFQNFGQLGKALECYNSALKISPDYASPRAHKIHLLAQMCDWSTLRVEQAHVETLGVTGGAISPFTMLAADDSPKRHKIRAQKYINKVHPANPAAFQRYPNHPTRRIRVGYFSADFHDHPGMHLMSGLLKAHDRTTFEIFAFSYGPKRFDEMRAKIVEAVDHFVDLNNVRKVKIHSFIKNFNLDIAVHRNGFTKNARTDLFSRRVAPIQINYLGYPGTLGAEYIDYIIGDHVVIPTSQRQHYTESVIYLPNSYQPNNDMRPISPEPQTREAFALPTEGFVFCCFNNSHKISEREFNIWMELLHNVPNSVLWLLNTNSWAQKNIKKAAQGKNISPRRIVFAEKIPNKEHLARHRLADLFLDTFNYNAHTTASDALWAGLPVITKCGKGFAARVASSALNAAGLTELITSTDQEYFELALQLASNPEKLHAIKAKLNRNRLRCPLFNTVQYTRDLEAGYKIAVQAYRHKHPLADIVVEG